MRSTYDAARDILTIDISDREPAAPTEQADAFTTLSYARDRTLVRVVLAQARKRGLMPVRPVGRAQVTVGWRAIRAFIAEYTVATRVATLLLIGAALLGITKELSCSTDSPCAPWVAALSGDGMMMILTLAVAFGVGVNIKQRMQRGLLDGVEHYSIGRALAYGYFSNFLLIALMQLRAESRARGLPRDQLLKLKVVFPASPGDLEEFKRQVTQRDYKMDSKRITAPKGSSKLLQRQINVIVGVGEKAALPDLFVDMPTTLYTMQDYFETWDVWLDDRKRQPLGPEEADRLYNVQIAEFFDHLADLFENKFGLAAARRVGFDTISEADLAGVFADHFQRIDGAELIRELQER